MRRIRAFWMSLWHQLQPTDPSRRRHQKRMLDHQLASENEALMATKIFLRSNNRAHHQHQQSYNQKAWQRDVLQPEQRGSLKFHMWHSCQEQLCFCPSELLCFCAWAMVGDVARLLTCPVGED
mmetsp:Transcript_62924/g.137486  ORF Transcript_62924/g.137486 Transcript_62924/m.137486 type:complete len:123 (-) Transcript_62924:37-405(-)